MKSQVKWVLTPLLILWALNILGQGVPDSTESNSDLEPAQPEVSNNTEEVGTRIEEDDEQRNPDSVRVTKSMKKKAKRQQEIIDLVKSNPKLQDELERRFIIVNKDDGKMLTSGLSVGWRGVWDSREYDDPSISIIDSTLSFDRKSTNSMIMSVAMVAFPFSNKKALWWFNQLGFMANINLVGISSTSTSTIFNKEIEGGIGFVLGNNEEIPFSLSISYEKIYSRQLRNYIRVYEGKQVQLGNSFLTEFDTTNNSLFKDTYLDAIAISLIYNIGGNKEKQIQDIVEKVLKETEEQ